MGDLKKSQKKLRKEVHLTEDVVVNLEVLASRAGRSLKNLMETILKREAAKALKYKT